MITQQATPAIKGQPAAVQDSSAADVDAAHDSVADSNTT